MTVRCKFVLTEIRNHHYGKGQTFVFTAQYDQSIPEDQRFATATPNGRFEMYVDNPPVQAAYKLGQAYYFDSTEVPAEVSA
jgi:hypothetical protein